MLVPRSRLSGGYCARILCESSLKILFPIVLPLDTLYYCHRWKWDPLEKWKGKAFQGPTCERLWPGKVSLQKQSERTAPGFPVSHGIVSCEKCSALSSLGPEIGPVPRPLAPLVQFLSSQLHATGAVPRPRQSAADPHWLLGLQVSYREKVQGKRASPVWQGKRACLKLLKALWCH